MQNLSAPIITMSEANVHGLRKDQIYQLISEGELERVGRGIFMIPGSVDPALIALAAATAARPEATLCLTSALVHHNLIDAIPQGSDIALPRGTRSPAGILHTIWHYCDKKTFTIGRTKLANSSGLQLSIYSPERCVIDMFRLAHLEGQDTAIATVKRWLSKPGNSPGELLEMARAFPKAEPSLRYALEVLL